jgi:hypothetical protein
MHVLMQLEKRLMIPHDFRTSELQNCDKYIYLNKVSLKHEMDVLMQLEKRLTILHDFRTAQLRQIQISQ